MIIAQPGKKLAQGFDQNGCGNQPSAIGDLHDRLANITVALVVADLFGIAVASFVHRENLVLANDYREKTSRAKVDGYPASDEPAMMLADFRIDQFDEMRLEALVRAFLIRTHQARIAHHIRREDRGETAGGGRGSHCSSGVTSRAEF